MRLTVVGCSGSLPGPTGPASCYLLEAQGGAAEAVAGAPEGGARTWRLLLDLGSGALGPLHAVVDPGVLDAVLLSHLHPDHCLDACGLHVALTYDPRPGRPGGERRLPVHGPGGTAGHLAAAFGAGEDAQPLDTFDVRPWTVGDVVRLGPLLVEVARVRHPVEAYAIRVTDTGDGAVLVYTGDTDSCPELVDLARGADVLLAEAAFQEGRDTTRGVHLTGRRAAETAREAQVGRLLLTHLPPWNDPLVVLADAASAGYEGPVSLARPGLVVDVEPVAAEASRGVGPVGSSP
ncbi:MBL fold metallo-hydrolase [Pseudokineococcus sp. 1T1Z-3]|uniref:MBL fold metallo-hydrolase n=1 Tax=Pseudokineococcus sp. 1T1Z-3 TaxID=3132745 RepID=UPI0030B1E7B0